MNWKDRYRAALVEIDPIRLLSLIHDTELAMSARSETLPAVTAEELQEMSDATCTLGILKSETSTGRT
ncbi:MAG TPA: hypothetical protein VJP02_21115 [Candidatus Sulfotelmatobacter sp.]|nr:hypothetical protein [Candidatus Sulfotelmatobacter sp.]